MDRGTKDIMSDTIHSNFATLITNKRLAQNLTIAEVGKAAEVDGSTVNRGERNVDNISFPSADRIARVLGISLAEIRPQVPTPKPTIPEIKDLARTYRQNPHVARQVVAINVQRAMALQGVSIQLQKTTHMLASNPILQLRWPPTQELKLITLDYEQGGAISQYDLDIVLRCLIPMVDTKQHRRITDKLLRIRAGIKERVTLEDLEHIREMLNVDLLGMTWWETLNNTDELKNLITTFILTDAWIAHSRQEQKE